MNIQARIDLTSTVRGCGETAILVARRFCWANTDSARCHCGLIRGAKVFGSPRRHTPFTSLPCVSDTHVQVRVRLVHLHCGHVVVFSVDVLRQKVDGLCTTVCDSDFGAQLGLLQVKLQRIPSVTQVFHVVSLHTHNHTLCGYISAHRIFLLFPGAVIFRLFFSLFLLTLQFSFLPLPFSFQSPLFDFFQFNLQNKISSCLQWMASSEYFETSPKSHFRNLTLFSMSLAFCIFCISFIGTFFFPSRSSFLLQTKVSSKCSSPKGLSALV